MTSTANAQHVPTTQHNTTLLLQHKTHSDGRSDTHKPFSLNNHTFFFFFCSVQPWLSTIKRAAKAISHWSRLISGGRPSCIAAAADGKREVKSPIFEDSRKKSSECSHPSNRLNHCHRFTNCSFCFTGLRNTSHKQQFYYFWHNDSW